MPVSGVNLDLAGGAVTATATRLIVGGKLVLRINDPVAPHGDSPHDSAVMAQGSARLIVEGIGVCRMGDLSTCGDALVATGARLVTA